MIEYHSIHIVNWTIVWTYYGEALATFVGHVKE